MRPRNKYNISPREQRTYNDRVYDSKAEMLYAQRLEIEKLAGVIVDVVEQKKFEVGLPEITYKTDFTVTDDREQVYSVDVKGVETERFRLIKRLWKKYGPHPLHIVKLRGKKFVTVEVITPQTP